LAHIPALAILFFFSLRSVYAGEIHIFMCKITLKRQACICEEVLQDQRKPSLKKQPTFVAVLGSGTLRHIHQN